jgi:DNA-3-methyladenine glycosylase II
MYKVDHPDIIAHLCKDKKLSKIIERVDISVVEDTTDVFEALIRAIVSQQLSVTAAKTIYGRFNDAIAGSKNKAKKILSLTPDQLRALGFSYQKAHYVHNVVQYFLDHDLMSTDWSTWSDQEILDKLTQIKGVGKWTVEMLLMFNLKRQDLLPLDDLIIHNHMVTLYKVDEPNKKLRHQKLEKIAEKWTPYRSIACRFLWAGKGLDLFYEGKK